MAGVRRTFARRRPPVGYLVLMVGDEFDRTVLRDHNCKAFRVLAAETISRTMPSSGVVLGPKDTMLRFDIEGAINQPTGGTTCINRDQPRCQFTTSELCWKQPMTVGELKDEILFFGVHPHLPSAPAADAHRNYKWRRGDSAPLPHPPLASPLQRRLHRK
jgi:hypothetical protein